MSGFHTRAADNFRVSITDMNVSSRGHDGLRRAAFDEIAEDSLGRFLRPGETSAVVFDEL
jgi:hypothetical protein